MKIKSDLKDEKSLLFEEEVNDNELVDKKKHNDIVYVETDNKVRFKFLIILAIVLFIISFFALVLGMLFADGKFGVLDGTVVNEYNLYVTHTNVDYGGSNIVFNKYNSFDNAYSYTFNVSNNNSVELDYSLELLNDNYNGDGVDMRLINYTLIKNNAEISTGKLEDIEKNSIYSTSISANSKDIYTIKLWSNTISKDLKFSFKMNVIV